VKRLSNTFKREVHIRCPFLLCLLSFVDKFIILFNTCIKMSDLRAIRVLILAKAKRSGIKDVLLGKLQIPKTSEELEEKSEEERRMMKNADLNELAFAELILSIDVSNSSGKIVFGI
jgi:hypothetical protein